MFYGDDSLDVCAVFDFKVMPFFSSRSAHFCVCSVRATHHRTTAHSLPQLFRIIA
jgi:hypothetical protein